MSSVELYSRIAYEGCSRKYATRHAQDRPHGRCPSLTRAVKYPYYLTWGPGSGRLFPPSRSHNPVPTLLTKKATLDPSANLRSGATYVATVTTGAKDLADNRLDQDSTTAGNQKKTWEFKVS